MMTNNIFRKRKGPQLIITILFIFSILAGLLSSCETVKPTVTEIVPATETPIIDETPWVELTPTETATETAEPTPTATAEPTSTVEATSAIFSNEYPVLWSESYTAEVGGMEIPIDIGLNYSIMYRSSEPITEIHIAEDVVDMVGDYFMHTCF